MESFAALARGASLRDRPAHPPCSETPATTTLRTHNRRDSLRIAATSPALLPVLTPFGRTMADETKAKNDRPRLGLIGAGGQGTGDARAAAHFGDFLAICDVDKRH